MAVMYIVACLSVLVSPRPTTECHYPCCYLCVYQHSGHRRSFGASIMLAIQSGIARGVFSNESGSGSAPMAAAAAKQDSCVKQGLVL
ncbi:alanine:cation symporter family protein [Vibrio chagasii]|nr:alanine:cation symporter family protein [Vibrio chagasii]